MLSGKPKHAGILAALAGALITLGGCSSSPGRMDLRPVSGPAAPSSVRFEKGYSALMNDGSYVFVFVTEGVPPDAAPSQVLVPGRSPTRQVVIVRVSWQPSPFLYEVHAAARNATVDWYVMPEPGRPGETLVLYSGVAFALVDSSEREIELKVSRGTLRAVAVRGDAADAIGPATFTLRAETTRDVRRVQQTLTEMEALRSIATAANSAGPVTRPAIAATPATLPSSPAPTADLGDRP